MTAHRIVLGISSATRLKESEARHADAATRPITTTLLQATAAAALSTSGEKTSLHSSRDAGLMF